MSKPSRLGIIAGGGELPLRLAEAAAAGGRDPFVVVLNGAAAVQDFARWQHVTLDVSQVGHTVEALHRAGCHDLVLGGILKRPSFSSLKPDWQGIKLLPRVVAAARQGDDALLKTLVHFLEDEGFRVIAAEDVLADLLAPLGVYGKLGPDDDDRHDIERAVAVVLALGALDIGQAAIVRNGLVLGVEAAEGTDALIDRCAGLQPYGRGGVLVKLAKPGQERRVDLPTIGVATVAKAASARLKGVAVEARGALVLDLPRVAAEADVNGLFVCGIARPVALPPVPGAGMPVTEPPDRP